ncbi:unnamed protein product [Trichogramma brassicae]|uniref:Uncharacterized protein n=1 Tax=Trichogramma brassicae TaxID=86971 RepID=A0A6H5IL81_9HYME|nr:unnamed protein product [Trichogramma brassicae]
MRKRKVAGESNRVLPHINITGLRIHTETVVIKNKVSELPKRGERGAFGSRSYGRFALSTFEFLLTPLCVVKVVQKCTEEGQKVTRNKGNKLLAVFRRIPNTFINGQDFSQWQVLCRFNNVFSILEMFLLSFYEKIKRFKLLTIMLLQETDKSRINYIIWYRTQSQ